MTRLGVAGRVSAWLLIAGTISGTEQSSSAVLSAARDALGGEAKLSAIRTIVAAGETRRVRPDGTTAANAFELFLELPDRYMKRAVVMAMGPTSIYRQTGFNGAALIDEMDTPPALAGGGNVVIVMRRAGDDDDRGEQTPEQIAARKQRLLTEFRQDLSRLALGWFAAPLPSYPLTFTHAGQAESPDGRADVLDVTGADGFRARLFVDAATRLPLMLTWQDNEPLQVIVEDGPAGRRGAPAGGELRVFRREGPGSGASSAQGGADPEMQRLVAEAEARRRTVEYRMVYSDYQTFDGVKLPSRVQRIIDGKTTEEMLFDRIRINSRIDPSRFQPSK